MTPRQRSIWRPAVLLLLCPTVGCSAALEPTQIRLSPDGATLAELIARAWGVESDHVLGGPRWLDEPHYEIDAVAAAMPKEASASALRQLLTRRFGLQVEVGTRQVAAYTLTQLEKPRLAPSRIAASTGCDLKNGQNPSTTPGETRPPVTLVCLHESLADFVAVLSRLREASGYLLNYELQDRTGLPGAWDFQLTWTPRNSWHADPVAASGQSLFAAIEAQLGMQLTLTSASTRTVIVRRARQPAVTRDDTSPQFDRATIQAAEPEPASLPCGRMQIMPGGVVRYHMTVRSLILESEGDQGIHRIVDPTRSIDSTCWSVLATTQVRPNAPVGWSGTEWDGVEIGSERAMLGALLRQRFGLKMHVGLRPVAGYALRALRPLLKRAEPGNRPGCHEGLGLPSLEQSRADPRLSNPYASRLMTCRDVTLREFVPQLAQMITGVDGPVMDATGLSGRYDFAVNFSPGAWRQAQAAPASELIPMAQALQSQLGLELQRREIPESVLIIDGLNANPADSPH